MISNGMNPDSWWGWRDGVVAIKYRRGSIYRQYQRLRPINKAISRPTDGVNILGRNPT